MSNILPFLRPAVAGAIAHPTTTTPVVPKRLPLTFLGAIVSAMTSPQSDESPPVKPLDSATSLPAFTTHPGGPVVPTVLPSMTELELLHGTGNWRNLRAKVRIAFGHLLCDAMQPWLGKSQAVAVRELIRVSKERDFYIGKMLELHLHIAGMPATHGQENVEDPIVHLHYFGGNYDAWITEKDIGSPDDSPEEFQWQMFGYARFAHMPEDAALGYICLPEMRDAGIELDFHWTPVPLSQVKSRHGENDEIKAQEDSPAAVEISNPLAEKQLTFLALPDGYQPGAIIDSSWGYDQTNIDWYRIVRRSGEWITLMPIRATKESDGWLTGKCVPLGELDASGEHMPVDKDPNADHDVAWKDRTSSIKSPTFRRKLRIQGGIVKGCTIEHGWASLWDGRPLEWTAYA